TVHSAALPAAANQGLLAPRPPPGASLGVVAARNRNAWIQTHRRSTTRCARAPGHFFCPPLRLAPKRGDAGRPPSSDINANQNPHDRSASEPLPVVRPASRECAGI